jgi:hypothetical protein
LKLPFANYVKRHHISRAALSVGVLVAAALFFAAGAVLRLLMGPVSLGPLRGTIADAIRQSLPGITLQYDQAAIEWSQDEGRINLVILGARLFDSGGRIVAQAPKADIDLAARPFLSGRFVVQRITLVGVQLALVRMQNGGIRLGVEADKGGDDLIQKLSDIINKGGGASTLQSFAVRDARLAIFDEPTGLFLVAPRAALSMKARGDAIEANFDADVEISGRKSHLTADLTLPPKDGPPAGTLTISGLDLRALGANAPKFAAVKNLPVIAGLTTRFAFAPGGKLARADFDATAEGDVPFALLKGKVLHVDLLKMSGRYDGLAHHLSVAAADLDAHEIKAQFKGSTTFTYDTDGKLQAVAGDIDASKLSAEASGILVKPVSFSHVSLAGTYTMGVHRLEVSKAVVTAPSLALEAGGTILFDEARSPGLVLHGTIAPIPVRTLLNYWPVFAATGAREWIDANVFAGTMGPAEFQTNFAPGDIDQPVLATDALKLTLAMKGVEANYLSGLTHLTGVDGTALLTGDDFSADFTAGRVGNLVVKSGHALIPALHQHGTVATFSLHADGAMPEIMTLLDMKPLNYATRFHIDPKTTLGTAGVDMSLRVPMLPDLPVDDVGISVKAAVNGFALSHGKLRLSDGAVVFDIDNNHLHQTGNAVIADQRFAIDYTEDFKTADAATSHATVKGLLTPAVRNQLNIDIGKIVTGSWPVTAAITAHRGDLIQADATVDLTPATITVPFANLGKPGGEAASARVLVNFTADGNVADQSFRVTGPGLSANGTASFDRNGVLTRVDFANVRRGPLNDLGFSLIKGANGDTYDLHGRVLDGSSIGRNASCNAPPGGAKAPERPDEKPDGAYRIIAHLDRLALCDDVSLAPFNLDFSGIGEKPSALSMSGGIGKATITAGLENTAQGRKVTVTAGDTGLLARALFSFAGLTGGDLVITALLPGRATDPDAGANVPDFQGNLAITNFRMVKQSFFARLFSSVSFTGIADLLQNQGITMDKFQTAFSSKNSVVSIKGAIFSGGIGGTADGYIDRPKNQVAVKGSLIPAYSLNSFVSNVPLLGNLLASKKGEGIFGVTYAMTGPTDQLDLSINPLSMLTPGFLRRIWEGSLPNASNAPTNKTLASPEGAASAGTEPAPVLPTDSPPVTAQAMPPKAN